MNRQRPVNLDLGTLRFPPMAIASILHRLTGLALFVLTPFLIYLLSVSLASDASFARAQALVAMPLWKCVIWAFACALVYHVLAGIRHLVMDFGVGESVEGGRKSAIAVIALAVVYAFLLGVWLW